MNDTASSTRHYWERLVSADGRWADRDGPSGADLAALRSGLGREPGDVPAMWRFYTTLSPRGDRSDDLIAEHIALSLYAVHQQSRPQRMHRRGIGLGTAMWRLREHEKFSDAAVDRRFAAAATATSPAELAMHLRGLVTQLRDISQPLDYTELFDDLRDWHHPERIPDVRRRWGSQYFTRTRRDGDSAPETPESPAVSI